jgi:hypothetical protein
MMSWKEVMENFQSSIDFSLYLIVSRNPQEPLGYISPLGYQHKQIQQLSNFKTNKREDQMKFTI